MEINRWQVYRHRLDGDLLVLEAPDGHAHAVWGPEDRPCESAAEVAEYLEGILDGSLAERAREKVLRLESELARARIAERFAWSRPWTAWAAVP